MDPRSSGAARGAVLVVLATLLGGCSSTKHDAEETTLARELVRSTEASDVAPGLTIGVAEALYGDSAPQICEVLDGGVSSAEAMLVSGNPAGRREKLVTTEAITYERLVVQTYCPDELSTYDDLVADIDGTS